MFVVPQVSSFVHIVKPKLNNSNMCVVQQAPSPQLKKEKGRRKCGLKPKKREGKGDEFLLQNGKQVQRTIVNVF